MKRRFFLLLTLPLFFVGSISHASTGFVDSPLLLSPEAPKDGDQVTLSVLFHNGEKTVMTGTVLFYDNQTLLERKNVDIGPGEVTIASTTFSISSGIHKFSATMSDVGTEGSAGKSQSMVIPVATVTLPAQIITRNLKLSAQANGSSDGTSAAILSKVDAAQTAVLKVVPPAAKEAVSSTATAIDTWRATTDTTLNKSRDSASVSIQEGKRIDASNATRKAGSKPIVKPSTADNGPLTIVKYYFFSFLAFFFGTPVVFYFAGIVLVYLILRFIFRRIRGAWQRRGSKAPAK
jgi:hypothetical protein